MKPNERVRTYLRFVQELDRDPDCAGELAHLGWWDVRYDGERTLPRWGEGGESSQWIIWDELKDGLEAKEGFLQ